MQSNQLKPCPCPGAAAPQLGPSAPTPSVQASPTVPGLSSQQAHRDGSCVFCLSALAPAHCLDSLHLTSISQSLHKLSGVRKFGGHAWEVWPMHQEPSQCPSSHSGVETARDQGRPAAGPTTTSLVAGKSRWVRLSRGTKQTQLQVVGMGRYPLPLAWSTWNRIGLTQDGGCSAGLQSLQPSGAGDACPALPLGAQ